jgi:hypothetical protein
MPRVSASTFKPLYKRQKPQGYSISPFASGERKDRRSRSGSLPFACPQSRRKKPAEEARARARRAAKREDYAVSGGTLAAAGWVILVTSLDAGAFPATQVGELYRIRHAGRMLSA